MICWALDFLLFLPMLEFKQNSLKCQWMFYWVLGLNWKGGLGQGRAGLNQVLSIGDYKSYNTVPVFIYVVHET